MECFTRNVRSDYDDGIISIYFTIDIDKRSTKKLTDILLEMPTMKLPDFKV